MSKYIFQYQKVPCFAKKGKQSLQYFKGADLNELVQGGQLYRAFPFSEGSMAGDTK
jgi:hypothetical protein